MLYILWVILNIGLLLFFLYLFCKAIMVVRKEMGLLPVIFMIIVLGNQCSHLRERDKNQSQTSNGISTRLCFHKIKLSPINSLMIDCATDSTGNVISKGSDLTGTVVGVKWEEMTVAIQKDHYTVVGILEWNLIGIHVWSQLKQFDGAFTKEDVAWDHTTDTHRAIRSDTTVIRQM